jgi:inorganic triphosphatase YgiF
MEGIMGREFELKFRATEAQQQALREHFDNFVTIRMETTYFDTPTGELSNRHVTLRLRKENDTCICTLKTPLPDGSRGEWECLATDIGDGIRALMAMGVPKHLAGLTVNGVIPRCGARFTRLAAEIATADGMAELALDSGILLGGNREIPLCEVEVELKSGSEAAAIAFARELADNYGLKEENKSKFRRAMDLAQGE